MLRTAAAPRRPWTRPATAVALGLLGLGLNALPVEILSGVHLLPGHVAVIAAATLLGPWGGLVAGAIAGAITPVYWGHPWAWLLFAAEGAAVGAATRRFLPLTAEALFWVGAFVPYLGVLGLFYPLGTAATIAIKAAAETLVAALVLQVALLAPGVHRRLRAWLPPPLLAIRTRDAVRSALLLAATLPLMVLTAAETRLLYLQRVDEFDRDTQTMARASAAALERAAAAGGPAAAAAVVAGPLGPWLPEEARVLVLDPAGDVVADTGGPRVDERFRAAILEAGPDGTATYLADPDSPRSLRPQATEHVAVAPVPGTELRVVLARSRSAIQGTIEEEALAVLAGLGVALVVVVFATVVLVRIVVAPVRTVAGVASRLEAGDRSARVGAGVGDAPAELRQLGEGFDRMADELERQLVAVERASKAKDEFLSVASHELKTPIAILKTQIQLLQRRAEAARPEQLRVVGRQIDRLTRLVSQLLDASSVGAGVLPLDLQEVDLAEVVRRVADGFADHGGCELQLALEPTVGRWDELRLEQVLHNLLGNAVKYSPVGATIDVTLGPAPEGGALLEIADRGIGLGTREGRPLFERFARGDDGGVGGLGIGLYVVREIVGRHGGTAELVARQGGGTVARVRLPRSAPDGVAPSTPPPP